MTRRRGSREDPAKPVSFDLQKHAAEAIVENVYSHTLGLAGYPPVFLGSAVAIRWKGRGLVVSADHVIRGVDDSQLLFAPRPLVPLKLNDGPLDAMRGRMRRLEKLPVIRRYSQKEKDVAALEVPLGLEGEKPLLRFYDLSESLTLPRPMPEHVTIIGFPSDALEQPEPGVWTFSGHLLSAQPRCYRGQTLKDFLPRSNFSSGSRQPLRGESYYDSSQILCALRIERILTFLRKFVG